MDTWQILSLVALVAAPFLLLSVFHTSRERLSSKGRPLARSWRPAVKPNLVEDDRH